MNKLHIVNFSHPMSKSLQLDVMRAMGIEPARITVQRGDPEVIGNLTYTEVKSQFDLEQPLAPQVRALLDGEDAAKWLVGQYAGDVVWVLPRLTEAAAVLVAELLDRVPVQYPVRVVRLVQDRGAAVPVFKLAEVVTLRASVTEKKPVYNNLWGDQTIAEARWNDNNGKWNLSIRLEKGGGFFHVTCEGKNELLLQDLINAGMISPQPAEAAQSQEWAEMPNSKANAELDSDTKARLAQEYQDKWGD